MLKLFSPCCIIKWCQMIPQTKSATTHRRKTKWSMKWHVKLNQTKVDSVVSLRCTALERRITRCPKLLLTGPRPQSWNDFTRLINLGWRSEATLRRANATGHLETPSAPPSLCRSINLANFPELVGGGNVHPEPGAGLRGFDIPGPPSRYLSLTPGINEEPRSKMRSLPVGEKKRNGVDREDTCSDKMKDSTGGKINPFWEEREVAE